MSKTILESAQQLKNELRDIYRFLHSNPELSDKEYGTMNYIKKYLADLGLEVKMGSQGTGLSAVMDGDLPGNCIGIRADIDALPIAEKTNLSFCSKKCWRYARVWT